MRNSDNVENHTDIFENKPRHMARFVVEFVLSLQKITAKLEQTWIGNEGSSLYITYDFIFTRTEELQNHQEHSSPLTT